MSTLNTTPGDTSFVGTADDDVIAVNLGNQSIDGAGGFDTLDLRATLGTSLGGQVFHIAGQGIDVDLAAGTMTAVYYRLFVEPTPQREVYNYTLTNIEAVSGSFAPDTMRAAISGSNLYGADSDDVLIGNVGSDVLRGGFGQDTLTGGGGADVFKFQFQVDGDRFAAFDSQASAIDSITDFETGVDHLDLTGIQDLSTVSIVRSGAGSAVFAQSTAPVSSTLLANLGVQSVSDLQTVIGVTGVIQASDIVGNYTSLQIVGDERVDLLIGGAKGDQLYGQDGADVLIGGGGGDALYGGAGADVFKYVAGSDSSASALDILHDFQTGVDTIDLTALNATNVSIVRYNGSSFIFGTSGGQAFEIASTQDVNAADLTGLTNGAYIAGDAGANTLIGGDLGETINGRLGNDVIIGGGGADALFGDGGEMAPLGAGAPANTFKYLAASDSTVAAMDIIHDFKTVYDKIDLTALAPTNVSILRYEGGSFISGVASDGQTFQIGSTQDVNAADLIGVSGPVYMAGDGGSNTLIGSAYGDELRGGAGSDALFGGGGADAIWGGPDGDGFNYRATSDSTPAAPDIIHDFTSADWLDLTSVHTSAGDTVNYLSYPGATYVFVQHEGQASADMVIILMTNDFSSADIFW